jgi:phosphate transport system substrate-binding protein
MTKKMSGRLRRFSVFIAIVAAVVSVGCGGPKVTRTDTETSGFARMAVDRTLMPVVEQELAVFTGLNAEAVIETSYVSEGEAFELLLKDSVRLIIAARDLSAQQSDSLTNMRLRPRSQRLACDGIALVVNPANPDSLMTLSTLRDILSGKVTRWSAMPSGERHLDDEIRVVFDHPSSSTLRFVRDSIMGGETFSTGLRALEDNLAVIDHVSKDPGALGVVGVCWIKDFDDPSQLNFNPAVSVVALGLNESDAVKPYPAYLNNGTYPLRRDVYIITSDSFGTLPAGFVKFAAGDAGQRIILKAGLVPGTRPSREVMLNEESEESESVF